MDLFIGLAHLFAFLALGIGLAVPRGRPPAQIALAAAALLGVLHAALGPAVRSLTTVHHYAGYEGAALEVAMRGFPTGTFTAPGWQWPLPFLFFAVAWILVLRGLGPRRPRTSLLLPLLFAWTATACWLLQQVLAAPAATVQPAGLDRFLWPAELAFVVLAARCARGLWPLTVMVSCAVVAARLPAALFSKLASELRLGTCLDVSAVVDIVNPMTKQMFDPPLVAGSAVQQFWLIWLEHVIIYPALHSLGMFGIALGLYLWYRHEHDPA
jgi:hypothetical protein